MQIKLENTGKDQCFAIYANGNEEPVLKSMKVSLTSTAKVIRVLTTMVRRHTCNQLLNAMSKRELNHNELNDFAEKMANAVCFFLKVTPEFDMMQNHPMFQNVLKKYESVSYFNSLLTATLAYSEDGRSRAIKVEAVQDRAGRVFRVRMSLQTVDERLVKLSARLVLPESGKFQIMATSTQQTETATVEFSRLTLPNDTKTYHDLLGAVHALPLAEITDTAQNLLGKKVW